MSCSFAATARPMMSVELPGVNATTMRTGLVGKLCASAPDANRTRSDAMNLFIVPPGLLWCGAGVDHDLAELLVFLGDEGVGLRRRHRHRLGAELHQPLLHQLRLQRALHLGVDLLHQR